MPFAEATRRVRRANTSMHLMPEIRFITATARFLSPTDPAAAWNTKEGRSKFGYFGNYLVDTDHAIIIDVERRRPE
jgi:hypothetical protein